MNEQSTLISLEKKPNSPQPERLRLLARPRFSDLNDIPITSSDGISAPEDIDLLGIDRMEVIKGPASALYGSGLGGNINLYTPSPARTTLQATLQHGSFNTTKAAAGGSWRKGDLLRDESKGGRGKLERGERIQGVPTSHRRHHVGEPILEPVGKPADPLREGDRQLRAAAF